MPERRPNVADLVAEGRLRLQEPDVDALSETLALAERDLDAAAANEGRFAPWAETMLYEAGLRAARAIVMAAGYRIAADRGHVTAIDAADALTNGRHHRVFVRLHRLRRRRHEFMYETAADPGAQELATARADVSELIRIARRRIREGRATRGT
jgi:hypothetical protein